MRIDSILKQRDKGAAFEFFPPKGEKSKTALTNTARVLKDYDPLYVSMTCGAGGGIQRPTEEAVYMLLEETGHVVAPHLTCIDVKKTDIDVLLDRYKNKGISNIIALRGDPPQGINDFCFEKQELCYASDLVTVVKNRGDFCIGVAVYPEGHIETLSLEQDMERTKQKIDSGADFAVTQMFFDNEFYYSFLDRAEEAGISIPILPGILPLTDIAKVKQFVSICRTTIPRNIEETMSRYAGNSLDMQKAGVEFTVSQCRDLIKNGFKQLHFFTLNKAEVMKEILDAVF